MTMSTDSNDFASLIEVDIIPIVATPDAETPPDATPDADIAELTPEAFANTNTGPTPTAGSIRSSGYVTPTGRDAFTDFSLTPAELVERAANRARSAAHHAAVVARAHNEPVAPPAPIMLAGVMPREQILANLANEGSGVYFQIGPSERRMTHRTMNEVLAALGTEFADLAPGIVSSKAQFRDTMIGLKNAWDNTSNTAVWAVTRKDVLAVGETWPTDVTARWCVGTRDGSATLGSLGSKTLVAELLADDTIRFIGGTTEIRDRVIGTFTSKIEAKSFNSTVILLWLRKTLVSKFHAIETCGRYYVPGNHPLDGRLARFKNACSSFMTRSTAIDDVITGSRLTGALLQGLDQMLDAIDESYEEGLDAARQGVRKTLLKLNPDATAQDLELAERRAIISKTRANNLLVDLEAPQGTLDGLAKLLGDADTAAAKARIAALRAKVAPLADVILVEMD